MRSRSRGLLAFILAGLTLLSAGALQFQSPAWAGSTTPPGPQPKSCTGGQGLTSYPSYGAQVVCGAFTATATINSGTQYHLGLYPNSGSDVVVGPSTNLADNGSLFTAGEPLDFQTYTIQIERPNDGTTGTTLNTLTTTTAAGNAIIVSHTTPTQFLGITVTATGTTGTARIAIAGEPSLVFDGATTAGDLVQASTTVDGNGHDTGAATCPTNSAPVIGRVRSTHASGGTYAIDMGSFGCGTAGLGTSTNGQLLTNVSGNVSGVTPSAAFSVSGNAITLAPGGVAASMLASGAAASNVGTLGGALTGTLPNPSIAASAVTNSMLANSSITLGSTTVALGGTAGVSGTPLTSVYLAAPNISGTVAGAASYSGNQTFSSNLTFSSLSNAPLLGTDASGNVRSITLGTGLSLTGTTLNASGGGGGSVTWPTSGDLVVSNGTNGPSGLAPVINTLLYSTGSPAVWTTLPTSSNSILCTNGSGAPSLCNASTVQSLLGYITGNQNTIFSGDASGSGTTAVTLAVNKVNGVVYPNSPSTNTVPVVTSTNNVSYYTGAQLAGVSGFGSMLQQNASSVAITGGSITGLGTPVGSSDAATKGYVDTVATSLVVHTQVRVATAAVLPNTPTYNNGSSGVGATLTSSASTTLTVDGTTVNNNDRVLVKNEATGANNGIYVATIGGSPWVLTRATDFNTAAAGNIATGAYVFVSTGSANAATGWQMNTTGTITVGSTALNWVQFLGNTAYTADETTLHLTGSQFSEKTNGTANAQLAQMAANTVKGNATGSTANAADIAMPSCSDTTGNHLNWVAGTGPTCGTSTGVSVTSTVPNIVITPTPGTGTFTVGTTSPINDQHGAGYAILTGDSAKTVLIGSFTYTLAQAGTTGFASGWQACVLDVATSGTATLTTTTSIFAGASNTTSLTLNPGDWACPNSDGTNYDTTFGHYTGAATADTVTTGVAAAGTTQGTATSIASQQNYVATGANCTTYPSCSGMAGVIIASALMIPGNHLYVVNEDANNALNIYPPTGDTINLFATNVPYVLGNNMTAHLIVKTSSVLRSVP